MSGQSANADHMLPSAGVGFRGESQKTKCLSNWPLSATEDFLQLEHCVELYHPIDFLSGLVVSKLGI